MTEEEARGRIRAHWGVSRETLLAKLVDGVLAESSRQNLIAPSTVDAIWTRHVVDSAQLLDLAGNLTAPWLDIGTGAGFPGLVVACLRDAPITLCEPRRRRADFLRFLADNLGIGARVAVEPVKVERLTARFGIISARAVATLDALFAAATGVSDRGTLWLLPKGRSAREEVEAARKTWHGSFHVEQSITDPESRIVVASDVRRR
ncbi:MAG TPA: RsmG family class I SAM-dependent methyltransferase [Sphingomonas sp.]|nr:RsmG family class I SAM-dependent methyltransferase [Sphingomonas sp.]